MSPDKPDEVTKGDKKAQLSQAQLNAIDLLLEGRTDAQVAAILGKARKTICYWRLYEPNFRDELDRRRQAISSAVHRRLVRLSTQAMDCLEELVSSTDPKMRRGVAKDILSFSLRYDAQEARGKLDRDQSPQATPADLMLTWFDDLAAEKGFFISPPSEEETPVSPPFDEEEQHSGLRMPGSEIKVHKMHKHLRGLIHAHPEDSPALKPLMRALNTSPEEMAAAIEKAQPVDQEEQSEAKTEDEDKDPEADGAEH